MAVLVDRAQGMSSLKDGQMEFMLHRRLLADDARGVREPLNETSFMSAYPNAVRSGPGLSVTGEHRLVLGPAGGAVTAIHRPLAAAVHMNLLELFQPLSPLNLTAQTWVENFNAGFSGMGTAVPGAALPVNVELMTVDFTAPPPAQVKHQLGAGAAGAGSAQVRLANTFGIGDHPTLSKAAQVDLASLFATHEISTITEMTLDGVRPLSEQPAHLVWHVQGEDASDRARLAEERRSAHPPLEGSVVTLHPLQIRTFNVSIVNKANEAPKCNKGKQQLLH